MSTPPSTLFSFWPSGGNTDGTQPMRDKNGFIKRIKKKLKNDDGRGLNEERRKLKPTIKESITKKRCRTPPSEKKRKKTAGVLFETHKRRGRRKKKNRSSDVSRGREKREEERGNGVSPYTPHALTGPE